MRNLVKKKAYLHGKKKNSSGGYDFVLKGSHKLSEIFNYIPSGIINKRETGIGATTLELESKRDSIIIEPLKSTVIQKANGNSKIFPYLIDNPEVTNQLLNYLADDSVKFKKIMLVIDNLERLINDIGDAVLNYFLLFDEIDFMQGSSSYRQKMEFGLDIGKSHGNFALVSATVIDFSDPDLDKLKRYSFSYQKDTLIPVKSYHISTPSLGVLAKRNVLLNDLHSYIIEQLKTNQDKILVALNSVKLIDKVASSLVKKGYIQPDEITLLISENKYSNRLAKEKYSNSDIQNNKLPTRINFITSAYFNGYDLYDNYRLVILTSPPVNSLMLTINEIKQIYGRNRQNGIIDFFLLSHDCLEEDIEEHEFLHFTEKEWLDYANTHVDMYNCIDKHFKKRQSTDSKRRATEMFYKKFQEDLGKNKFVLSRKKSIINRKEFVQSILNTSLGQQQNAIAYYQIDYLLYIYQNLKAIYINPPSIEVEGQNVYLPNNYSLLEQLIENRFQVTNIPREWNLEKIEATKLTHKEEIAELVEFLEKEIKENSLDIKRLDNKHTAIYEIFKLTKDKYSLASVKRQILGFKSFDELYNFRDYLSLKAESSNHILFRQIKHHFKAKNVYTSDELKKGVILIHEELNRAIPKNLGLKKIKSFVNLQYDIVPTKKRDSATGKQVSAFQLKANAKYSSLVKKK
jgi:hypothetical protein